MSDMYSNGFRSLYEVYIIYSIQYVVYIILYSINSNGRVCVLL